MNRPLNGSANDENTTQETGQGISWLEYSPQSRKNRTSPSLTRSLGAYLYSVTREEQALKITMESFDTGVEAFLVFRGLP